MTGKLIDHLEARIKWCLDEKQDDYTKGMLFAYRDILDLVLFLKKEELIQLISEKSDTDNEG